MNSQQNTKITNQNSNNIWSKVKNVFSYKSIYTLILCLTIIFMIILLVFFRFDRKTIQKQNKILETELKNSKMQALINGSGINNIPNLNIITNNNAIKTANQCGQGPVYIGDNGNDQDCIRICENSSAHAVNVSNDPSSIEYFNDGKQLKAGVYCSIGPRPECNTKTTQVIMTVNSVTCRSKYPDLVGGPLGNTIIACNNNKIYDPHNILWDNRENEPFSPYTTIFDDVNEMIDENTYRFTCKFDGYDENKNKYIESPLNRFHPYRNYCAQFIYAAHPDVQTKFIDNNQSFICDCGDFEVTRVQNLYKDFPQSPCSNIQQDDKVIVRNKRQVTIPYKCFTLFSPITDVGTSFPCPNEQFTRDGSRLGSINVIYTTDQHDLIEHPEYEKFQDTNTGVEVKKNIITT